MIELSVIPQGSVWCGGCRRTPWWTARPRTRCRAGPWPSAGRTSWSLSREPPSGCSCWTSGPRIRPLGPCPGPAATWKKDKYRREGPCCCLGNLLEGRTSQLTARMIWRNILWKTSILVGWWFDWCGVNRMVINFLSNIHSAKYPLIYSSNHPGCKIASAPRNWINSVLKHQRRPLPSLLYSSFLFELLLQGRVRNNKNCINKLNFHSVGQ